MEAHSGPSAHILNNLKTDVQAGLTSQEAALRLKRDGPNKLGEKKKKSTLHRFSYSSRTP